MIASVRPRLFPPAATESALLETLCETGIVTERIPCLVAPSGDSPEYEVPEFGRLLLEEGVLALFEVAESVDAHKLSEE